MLDFCSSIPIYFLWKKSLFDRNNQYNCYSKIFTNLILDNEEELAALGASLDTSLGDLSIYSARKGVRTPIATGYTVSPSIASLYLRMEWAMHGVLERYIKLAKASDMVVRRIANLNDPLRKEYATSNLTLIIWILIMK